LACDEINLPIICTHTWDFPTFDHFIALAVRCSFLDRHLYDSKSMEYNEEHTVLMLHWSMVTS
jgi:hypothetical protein